MLKKTYNSNIFRLSLAMFSLVILNSYIPYKKTEILNEYSTLSPNIVKILSFGNTRLVSSFLWTKTLLEADTEHMLNNKISWLFYRFNLISELDPTFYENYLQGGIYLSIIKDDIYGAETIFNKGLTHYPDDFQLNYHAAFNYHFQIKNFDESLRLYKKILSIPNPMSQRFLKVLINQAEDKSTNPLARIAYLTKLLEDEVDENARKRIIKRIENIKKESKSSP